jgi:hypothetical protein
MPTDKIVTWNATAGRGKVKTLAFLPNAGTLDQVLVKSSSADGDAVWKTLSQAMITSALADGSLSPTLISQNTNNKFVTDAQISTWNAKVNTTDLANYLPLAGGFMTGALRFSSPYGQNYISKGTGDGATSTIYNLEIASWYGIAFKDTCYNTVSIVFDTRAGKIQAKKIQVSDFANGVVDAPVVSSADGTLAKKAISAVFVTESTDKRFVTDSQISSWNAKISGIALEEDSTVKSTGNTSINFSHGAYAIVSVVGKVIRYNVDVVTDNSRWLDTVTNPVATNLVKSKLDGKADWGHGHSWDSISGKPTEFNPTGHSHHWDSIYGKPGIFSVLLRENGGDRSVDAVINFSNGTYNVAQVDGNTVRYHVDVVTDNSRWADWCTNPVATNLVKSKLDGKADWGHGHSWDSISGKPFDFNGSSVSTNYWFNSKHGSVMEGMNYIGNINSEVISSNAVTTNELRLNNTPNYAKSSAPSGYLTLDGNRVIFVNSFN